MKSKFNAIKTTVDGITFHSRKESRYYETLKAFQKTGDLKFFLRQVPFHLPGGVRYIVDFVEFWGNGDVRFVDIKGYFTAISKTKIKIVESLFPVKICLE